jgi:hypothetical protein
MDGRSRTIHMPIRRERRSPPKIDAGNHNALFANTPDSIQEWRRYGPQPFSFVDRRERHGLRIGRGRDYEVGTVSAELVAHFSIDV